MELQSPTRGDEAGKLPIWRFERRARSRRALVEALESRCLLSAIPAEMLGTFEGASRVAFSPHTFHENGLDPLTLSINTEGSDGSVVGTINDQLAGMLSLSGVVKGRRLTASLGGAGISGQLTGRLAGDGIALTGRVAMSMSSGPSPARWRGSFVLKQPRGPLGFFMSYAGWGHGLFRPDLSAQARPTRTTHQITLAVTGQTEDGTLTGELDGFQFSGLVMGQITGQTFSFHFDPRYVAGAADSSVSGIISSDGRILSGRYTIEFGTYIRTDTGRFRIRVAAR